MPFEWPLYTMATVSSGSVMEVWLGNAPNDHPMRFRLSPDFYDTHDRQQQEILTQQNDQ